MPEIPYAPWDTLRSDPEETRESEAGPESITDIHEETREIEAGPESITNIHEKTEMVVDPQFSHPTNIISNHDFSEWLNFWYSNSCHADVVSEESGFLNGLRPKSGANYAVVTGRSETWQGLEQDITGKVIFGRKYGVLAYVGVSGDVQGTTEVEANLRLIYPDSSKQYIHAGRVPVTNNRWEELKGFFLLPSTLASPPKGPPQKIAFYLNKPPRGVDLLIDSVYVSRLEKTDMVVDPQFRHPKNIISNHDFSERLNFWVPNCCDADVVSEKSGFPNGLIPKSGANYAVVTDRTETWQGLEQDITGKVMFGTKYGVSAYVGVSGDIQGTIEIEATLRLVYPDSSQRYLYAGSVLVTKNCWEELKGFFSLSSTFARPPKGPPHQVIFYFNKPPRGVNLLIDSVNVFPHEIPSIVMGKMLTGVNKGKRLLAANYEHNLMERRRDSR